MSIISEKTHVTLEELLASEDAGRFEIVDGQLEEVHVSNLSTKASSDLHGLLNAYCKARGLGEALDSNAYYQCFGEDGSHARKPDVSFVSRERLPPNWLEEGYLTIPPDLAVEVISTNDPAPNVRIKIEEYLQAGVKLVWEVEPESRTVLIHRLDGTTQMLHDRDTLSGESVVPGFTCKVADFLP
jgi:Uma2 family endonuclease